MFTISELHNQIQRHRSAQQKAVDQANALDECSIDSPAMRREEWFQREKTRALGAAEFHRGAASALLPILATLREDRGFRTHMSEPEGYTEIAREDGSTASIRVNVRWTCRDEGSAIAWAVFPPDATDNEIDQVLAIQGHYSGPGRHFAHDACIRRGKYRILVTKMSGLDI